MGKGGLPGIGIFGTGTIAHILISVLRNEGFVIEALWGRTKEKASEMAISLSVPFYTNRVDDVLLHANVDLVAICCDPGLHLQIAVKALGIGKHVICDNPSSVSHTDAFKMVSSARYYPALLSKMSHALRFLPAFSTMKRMIDESYLGEVYVCEVRVHCGSLLRHKYDWLCDETMGGGLLNLVGGHVVDVISYVTGQRPVKVHGMVQTFVKQTSDIKGIRQITSDDFCTFQMKLDRGALATVTLSAHHPGKFTQEMIVIGANGRLVINGTDLYSVKNHPNKKEELITTSNTYAAEENKLGLPQWILAKAPNPLLKGMIRFVACLKESFEKLEDRRNWAEEPIAAAATFEDGLYTQTVLDAIRKSSDTGHWEDIVIMTEEPDPDPFLTAALRRSTLSLYT